MFRLLILNHLPIIDQLRLEEALLRTHSDNWCLVNTGSPDAIVMGISGKPQRLIDLHKVKAHKIPIIKRFSGGGTVYIDQQTVFVTWICNQNDLHIPPQPKPILEWSAKIYQPLFKNFLLNENDYVLGDKKCGGNALYLQKSRWLLHSSFLWDFEQEKMDYLLMPEKRPVYRQSRPHQDFLCNLKPFYPDKNQLINTFLAHFQTLFPLQSIDPTQLLATQFPPHRTATTLIESNFP